MWWTWSTLSTQSWIMEPLTTFAPSYTKTSYAPRSLNQKDHNSVWRTMTWSQDVPPLGDSPNNEWGKVWISTHAEKGPWNLTVWSSHQSLSQKENSKKSTYSDLRILASSRLGLISPLASKKISSHSIGRTHAFFPAHSQTWRVSLKK